MEDNSQSSVLLHRIEHFLKNKLQAILGGGFLVESGLKMADLETIRRGWNIVSNNQHDVKRSIDHLLALFPHSQSDPEKCDLAEQTQIAIREFETQPDLDGSLPKIEYDSPLSPVLVWGDPQFAKSAIFGLLRIAFQASRQSSKPKIFVKQLSSGVELSVLGSDLDWDSLVKSSSTLESREFESILLEWSVAEYTVERQGGTLKAGQNDRQLWFRIELPSRDSGSGVK